MRTASHHNALATVIRGLAWRSSPACLVDRQGAILFVNNAWDDHAVTNGGAPSCLGNSLIGTSWIDHIRGEEVRTLYREILERVLTNREPRHRPVCQVGESNTPSTAALVSTQFEPVMQGGDAIAVGIVHSTVRVRPISEVYEIVHRPVDAYRDSRGELLMCSCCRRVRDPEWTDRWDLVPEILATPPPVSYSLCDLCAELHCRHDPF